MTGRFQVEDADNFEETLSFKRERQRSALKFKYIKTFEPKNFFESEETMS